MLWIFPDLETLSRAAAALFVRQAQRAIRRSGRFVVALAGGQTPRRAYEWLAHPLCRDAVAWEAVYVFWGDERCVPLSDPRSNARMAWEALLRHVPIPPDHVYPIVCEGDPASVAARYEAILRGFFGETPRFDLVLLGLGEDGHTASLFPFHPALEEPARWATGVETMDPPRVTLTFPALNQARRVVFLVAGSSKAVALRETLQGAWNPQRWPAQRVRPIRGSRLWMVDQAAAELLRGLKPASSSASGRASTRVDT
ncbi:6-phosphogluconolactonase [Thermoflexus sp.]|uniref:6-phosphogluconolactonase n=1 Tax=Thermoflexus sp. TaxID=1969742 RepID=UPI0025FB5708|nr:6-phosphogluconolactonase [Thermoflexus sp.]MCS6964395.1 6-phosphogluconolactonase [Thermoflexus sp.]